MNKKLDWMGDTPKTVMTTRAPREHKYQFNTSE